MRPALKHSLLGAVLLVSALLSSPVSADYSLDAAAIREVLAAAMRCQSVRQLHAAVVHRGSDVFSARLELQSDGQVTDIADRKLLYLASVSKGMFGTALVRVEQHLRTELKNPAFSLFNTPIKQLLGDENFWFLDHIRSELVTIDDLVSHRTGLARHDAMWYLGVWQGKQDLVNHVGRLKASADYRNSFVYNNLAWALADVVVQKLTNRTFVQYMREHLWNPLDMQDTFGSSQVTDGTRLSRMDSSRQVMTLGLPLDMSQMERGTRLVEAAGGILTSLSDMMKYMKLHASHNYSADEAVPGQFRALNALAAEAGMTGVFLKQLFNESITNLPDWETESYGRGWMRTWYRNHMDYSHGGSVLGVRSELDIYPKLNLAVFNHMTLGAPVGAPFQQVYPIIVNKYITDLLFTNQSFVTKDNVCSLFKRISTPGGVVSIPRRHLTAEEVDALRGSYGNYGFGKVLMAYNQTTKAMVMTYGVAVLELIPVTLETGKKEPYQFFVNLLEPVEAGSISVLLNRTDDVIVVPRAAAQSPQIYLTVSREADGKLAMQTPIIDAEMKLHRDLDPSKWTRPKLCPGGEGKSAGRGATAAGGAGLAAAAVILLIQLWNRME